MEIGPLSEWVTAFAEIAAVSVALFLPVYDKRQERRKRTRSTKIIFRYLIKKALEENDTTDLESYFKIDYLLIDNDNDKQIYSIVQQAIDILKNSEISQRKKEEGIAKVIEYLKQ